MAVYAEQQDIIDLYGLDELVGSSDRTGAGVPDAGVVAKALADASNVIDSWIQEKYQLPLPTPPPSILVTICVDIALYRMSTKAGANLTEEKRKRFDDAMAQLKAIGRGDAKLGSAPQPATATSSATLISDKRRFSRRKLRGIL